MKWISPLISEARNKIGGLVYSKNPYGQYVRNKTIPHQPRTATQQANRAQVSEISPLWRILTPAQRLGWNNYALRVRYRDSLGQSLHLSGFQHFTRANLNLTNLGRPHTYDAPPHGNLANPATFTLDPITHDSFGDLVLIVRALHFIDIVTTSGVFHASEWQSAGTRFFSRQVYRLLRPPYLKGSSTVDLSYNYQSGIGDPPVGSQISVRFIPIDYNTGEPGPPTEARNTVVS
jgi:hypothetical protein